MRVNKVGRPSKAVERRAEILQAMAAVVARDGLAGTTIAKVADRAGMHRTLVTHYFGDRAGLIEAFVDEIVAAYGDHQILGDPDVGLEARLADAFSPQYYDSPDHLVVWNELIALAARDPELRARLQSLWQQRWLPTLEDEVGAAYPNAPRADARRVAYALACLVEAHGNLELLGVATPRRRRDARRTASQLLQTLGPASQ